MGRKCVSIVFGCDTLGMAQTLVSSFHGCDTNLSLRVVLALATFGPTTTPQISQDRFWEFV